VGGPKQAVSDKTVELDFFQWCLAKSRGSTPEQRYDWREGIYEEIRELMPMQGSLGIDWMCQLAGVSRAGFYRSFQQRAPVEAGMATRSAIREIAVARRRRYGYRRIMPELRHRGVVVNHRQVLRILNEDNLMGIQRRPFLATTDCDHRFQVHLNLASRMELTGMNPLAARLPIAALEQAMAQRQPPPGLVHHSNRGVQFACGDCAQVLQRHQMIPSICLGTSKHSSNSTTICAPYIRR
jgi:putative transposase